MNRFRVYDSLGKYLRSFPSYPAAMPYKIMCGRHDWKIK